MHGLLVANTPAALHLAVSCYRAKPELLCQTHTGKIFTGETSYLLPLTSYLLLLTSYFLPPTSYFLPPTSYLLLFTSYFLLLTSYFLLLSTSYFSLHFAGENALHILCVNSQEDELCDCIEIGISLYISLYISL